MASKNIVAKGATYNGVESVTFPTSPSGTATFFEVSDTTATASDVLNSKYFYTAAGVLTQGTGTAPSPTLITKSITANGTYDAEDDDADGYSSVTVSVSGGGGSGLVYETGTWTPSEDVAQPVISFSGSHSSPPLFVMMADATGTDDATTYTNYGFAYSSFYEYTGQAVPSNETTSCRYALADYVYRTSASPAQNVSGITALTGSSSSSVGYWVSETGFIPSSASTTRYWRSGRTYKWIAVWAPTT